MRPRLRIVLILLCALLAVALLSVLYQAMDTLARLDVVERDRDPWQRAGEIVQALQLKEGETAVDLGSGAGYFTLKLSDAVGKRGKVLAVDLRKMSLAFLWVRALRQNRHNVTVLHGDAADAGLWERADAVLVVNTYHEFQQPRAVLDRVRQSLAPGGRLVIADRRPSELDQHHEIPLAAVEKEVRDFGFDIVRDEDHFLEQPGDGSWWLIVARKR